MHAIAVIHLNLNPLPKIKDPPLSSYMQISNLMQPHIYLCKHAGCLLTCLLTVAGHCPVIDVLTRTICTYILCVACNFTYIRWSVMNSLTAYFHRTLPVASVNVTFDGVPEVNFNLSSCILGPW